MCKKNTSYLSDNQKTFLKITFVTTMNILYFGIFIFLNRSKVLYSNNLFDFNEALFYVSLFAYLPVYGILCVKMSERIIWPNVLLFVSSGIYFIWVDTDLEKIIWTPIVVTIIATAISAIAKLIMKRSSEKK